MTICTYRHSYTITNYQNSQKITADFGAHTLTDMSARGSLHERGVAILVLVLYVRTSVEQDLDHVFIASATSIGEGSVTNAGLGIDVGSVVDQEFHNISIATRSSLHERGRITCM